MRPLGLLIWILVAPSMLFAAVTDKAVRYERNLNYANIAPGEYTGTESEKAWLSRFNAKVVLRSTSGAPYGGAYVRIYDAAGVRVLGTLCEKSWLLLHLPVGDYHVIAVDRNQHRQLKPFHVSAEGQKEIQLRWPKEQIGY